MINPSLVPGRNQGFEYWRCFIIFFFVQKRRTFPVPTEITWIALMLYGKMVSDCNPSLWDTTCLTFSLNTPMIFCNNPLQCAFVKLNLAAFLGLHALFVFFLFSPIRLWLFKEILWNANGDKQNVIAAVWWLRGRTNDVPTPGSGRV